MEVTRTKFAELAGVSPAAITKACRPRGPLANACLNKKKIETGHPEAIIYMDKRGRRLNGDQLVVREPIKPKAKARPKPVPQKPSPITDGDSTAWEYTPNPETVPTDFDLRKFDDMPFRQVCEMFGTDDRFRVWVAARKTLADTRKAEINNAKVEGMLVSRELVSRGILEPIDTAHRNLLSDGALTITTRVIAMHTAGNTQQEIREFIEDQIGSFIRPAKDRVKRAMQNV